MLIKHEKEKSLTFRFFGKETRMIEYAARKAEMSVLDFIKTPKLDCWYCPCGDKQRNTCPAAGGGSCREEFYKLLFSGVSESLKQCGAAAI
jgi:hypothetical protein